MPHFSTCPAGGLIPDGLSDLTDQGEAEGIGIVARLAADWSEGSQRYEQPGELLLAAIDASGAAVGIGGLTRCPHVLGAYRVRRFYVAPPWRRNGIARALAVQLIQHGFEQTDMLTCNARATAAAAPFWETMGFVPSDLHGITHTMIQRPAASNE